MYKRQIQNVDINISQKSTENDMQEKLSEKDKRKLKDYLSGVYEIDERVSVMTLAKGHLRQSAEGL